MSALRGALLGLCFLATGSPAFAHGENVPGPHGGAIRMPGAFHTELVVDPAKMTARLYLLDVEFKNPTTLRSKLTVTLKRKGQEDEVPLSCGAEADSFNCKIPGKKLKKGDVLRVLAERDGQMGGVAEYAFPFKISSHEGHEGHKGGHLPGGHSQ